MITALGKELRILRMDEGEKLKDMAEKLNMSSAYLSAIENGNRKPTETMLSTITEVYRLSEDATSRMRQAFIRSIDELTLAMNKATDAQKDLGMCLARELNNLSQQQIEAIQKILQKDRKEED